MIFTRTEPVIFEMNGRQAAVHFVDPSDWISAAELDPVCVELRMKLRRASKDRVKNWFALITIEFHSVVVVCETFASFCKGVGAFPQQFDKFTNCCGIAEIQSSRIGVNDQISTERGQRIENLIRLGEERLRGPVHGADLESFVVGDLTDFFRRNCCDSDHFDGLIADGAHLAQGRREVFGGLDEISKRVDLESDLGWMHEECASECECECER